MRARYALLAVGLPLLALGGEGLYYVARSRRQETMTCEQFARQRPPGTWVRLTGCALDYDAPGYREANGKIEEIYFPVRPAGQPKNAPAPILAATKDPGALALVQGTIGDGRQADQEAVTVMMLRVVTLLKAAREVQGRTRASVVERVQTRRSLATFQAPLQEGYAVIDLHQRPDVMLPAIEAGTGIIAVLLFALFGTRRRAAREAVLEAVTTEAADLRLPAMLVLNLDTSAGLDAIEHAPPLGNRDEVAARLASALGELRFDDTGRATCQRPDYTLHIELGTADPVWTVTIHATGPGAPEALRMLVKATSWRIYVPKRGAFMDHGQIAGRAG